jgi:hypothetical protein
MLNTNLSTFVNGMKFFPVLVEVRVRGFISNLQTTLRLPLSINLRE